MKHPTNYQAPFWKLALGGVIAGAAVYFFPFLIPAIAFVFLMGLLFRLFFGFGHWGGRHMHMRHAYAAHWQGMSTEQRDAMRQQFRERGCGRWQAPDTNDTNATNPTTNS